MENPTKLTDPHYEALGRIILSLPDRNDEVKCLQVKELFNDEEIFDIINGELFFYAKVFIEKYPTIEEAYYYAEKIKEISNPSETILLSIPEESFIGKIGLAENTGGNIFNDVIELKGRNEVIVISSDGISIYRSYDNYEDGISVARHIFEDVAEKAFNKSHPELNP